MPEPTRPRKPVTPRRTTALLLKLTPDEKVRLTQKAKRAKKSRAAFIRDAALAA